MNTITKSSSAVLPRSKWRGRAIKFFLYGLVSIVIMIFLFQIAWKMSGSNQWELAIEENGIKIYTLKSPGSSVLKTKGIVRVRAKLATIVGFFQDHTTCEEFGCFNAGIIEEPSQQLSYSTFSYPPFPLPLPYKLKNREFVVKSLWYQDPESKTVFFDFTAVPGKIPPSECCFRVTHFYNFWQFTPLESGEVEVEWIRDIDLGGFMPDYFINSILPRGAHGVLSRTQSFLDREKYQNMKFDFIEEAEF